MDVFHRFAVPYNGISTNFEKVKVMVEWPESKTISEVG